MARFGFVERVTRNRLIGWAVDTDRLAAGARLSVRANGAPLTEFLANTPREDTALLELVKGQVAEARHAEITGRFGFDHALDPPLSPFRAHDVSIRFMDGDIELADGRKTLACPAPGHLALTPVLVTALGRSGTTILMRYLAQHPGIVVADQYPYEIKLLSYYADVARVLSMDADHQRSDTPNAVLNDRYAIGFNPFSARPLHRFMQTPGTVDEHFGLVVPTAFLRTGGQMVMDYYRRVQADQGKRQAVYVAEKAPPRAVVRDATCLMAGQVRTILLVRDPRDILCSATAFWGTDQAIAIRNTARLTRLMEALHQEATDDTLLVRYEDMVTDTPATLAKIWGFLGLPPAPAIRDLDSDLLVRHVTSASPAASIGRWRQDLSPAGQQLCRDAFSGFMARFGYA